MITLVADFIVIARCQGNLTDFEARPDPVVKASRYGNSFDAVRLQQSYKAFG